MKPRCLFPLSAAACLLAAAGPATAAFTPELRIAVAGGDAVLSWRSEPVNPGSGTELFYGFQLERSPDLHSGWIETGAPVPARIGGGAQSHTVRVPVTDRTYFRLTWNLDLSGRDLSGADLAGTDFAGADLEGTDFSGAGLAGVSFFGARFESLTLTSLGGPADRRFREAVPALPCFAGAASFTPGDPDLPDYRMSHSGLFVLFEPAATTAGVNAILAAHGARIAGSLPSEAEDVPAICLLKFPVNDHAALRGAAAALEAHPLVQTVARDSALGLDAVPQHATEWAEWPWSAGADQPLGNWGLRAARIPQLWNFNRKLRDLIVSGARTALTPVAVLDAGFYFHPADFHPVIRLNELPPGGHGAHVCGIIGAKFSFPDRTSVLVDGVNPFAQLFVADVSGLDDSGGDGGPPLGGDADDERSAMLSTIVSSMFALARRMPSGKAAMNLSLGYGWHKKRDDPATPAIEDHSRNPMTDAAVQVLVQTQAQVFRTLRRINSEGGRDILYITSAGNSSHFPDRRTPLGEIDARWNSPWNYAALVQGEPSIIVVEATRNEANDLYAHSCTGGHVLAPGEQILSYVWPNAGNGFAEFKRLTGTSMAAPHVTGVVSLLWMLDPSLTGSQIQTMLRWHEGSTRPRNPLNAFAAAMEIDFEQGTRNILEMLVDVDDGTRDGNTRIERIAPETPGAAPVEIVAAAPRAEGDGAVDMADFRTWRDWLLQYEHGAASPDIRLDGPADHPCKDLNGDGLVQAMARENVYPRGDFNGDRIISRQARVYVSGAITAQATDLEVLQEAFAGDPYWDAAALPQLQDSYDVHICLDEVHRHNRDVESGDEKITTLALGLRSGDPGFKPGAYPVRIEVPDPPPGPAAARFAVLTLTLPSRAPDYRERFEIGGLSAGGDPVPFEEIRLTETKPGADFLLVPAPAPPK